uniref:Uncharacterized protein n=1 Tax=Rhizophora mucronata TaxID=61149 RepID=A0A2P2J193_RHIMU
MAMDDTTRMLMASKFTKPKLVCNCFFFVLVLFTSYY